jgi:hypothetical protein
MSFVKLFLSTLILTLPHSIISDSIEINEWDVSDYTCFNGTAYEYEAKVYAGETVTFTYTPGSVVQFSNGDAYDSCNMTAATEVDTSGSFEFLAWPFSTTKGNQYFASGTGDDCANGKKIKLQVRRKQFRYSDGGGKNKACEGIEGATATVFEGSSGPAKGASKCRKKCQTTQDCFGFEWKLVRTKARKWIKTKTCTLFDVYPEATGPRNGKKVICQQVRYNNTDDCSDD